MVKSGSFTYIHPMKCGGTFINEILLNTTNAKKVGDHCPRHMATPDQNFITSVRNPFDWYVSYYHHSINNPNDLIIVTPSDNFKDVLTQLLKLRESDMYFGLSTRYFGEDVGGAANFTSKDFIDYPENIGFYSWYWNRMVADKGGNVDDVHVIKTENLREDLIATISKFDVISDYTRSSILENPRANSRGEKESYRDYYDQELIDMVYKMDKPMFDRFGYQF